MKRSWSDQVAAYSAIADLAARRPLLGLGVRWTGVRTSEAFEIERIEPNAYLVATGCPDRFWVYTDGTPVVEALR